MEQILFAHQLFKRNRYEVKYFMFRFKKRNGDLNMKNKIKV